MRERKEEARLWQIRTALPISVPDFVSLWNRQMLNPLRPAPVRVLTAHNVFDWSFNFEFLTDKAAHELNLSFSEGPDSFYRNAMNFSVTIQAIADHLWWIKAINDPQWEKQSQFVHWVTTQNDCIAAFLDLANNYKHSDRRIQNYVAEHLKLYPDNVVEKNSDPPDELELTNAITDKRQSTSPLYWPVITTNQGRLIYYRYAAESALQWWGQYEGG